MSISTRRDSSRSEKNENTIYHWLEMLKDFGSFTEDVKSEHHTCNPALITDVRITIPED